MAQSVRMVCLILSLAFLALSSGLMAAAQQVTITYARWGPDALIEDEERLIARFMELHPHIKVETIRRTGWEHQRDAVMVEKAAGVAPDVVMATGNYLWVTSGVLLPLDPYMARDPDYIRMLNPVTLSEWQYENQNGILIQGQGFHYTIPYNDFTTVIAYNQDLYDEAGLVYPSRDWTYEDLADHARRLTRDTTGDGEYDIFGVSWFYTSSTGMGPIAAAYGSNWEPILIHGDGTIEVVADSPEFYAAVDTLRQWMWEFNSHPRPGQPAGSFAQGRIGIWANHNDGILPMARQVGDQFRWDIAAMPAGPHGRYTRMFTQGLSITADSKHPDEAWEFIKFMTGAEAAKERGARGASLPSHLEGALAFLEQQPFSADVMLDSFSYGRIFFTGLPLTTDINQVLAPVWENRESLGPVLSRLAELYRQEIADFLAQR